MVATNVWPRCYSLKTLLPLINADIADLILI